MEATIEVSRLSKRFGSALALDGMSFTVLPGQVTWFAAQGRASLEEAYMELTRDKVEFRAAASGEAAR